MLRVEEPPDAPPRRFALWDLGFRPFYLLASVFAALSIALWALQFSGLLGQPYLSGAVWHAHEMLFGFALAVIVGFLFTAGRNWAGQPTPTGWALGGLAALWLAARILVLTPFAVAAATANIAFPLAAAIGLAVPFARSGNRRNYFFVGLLTVLSAAAGVVHFSQLGIIQLAPGFGIGVALDVILFIMSVMGGRVIPMFTNNGVPGAGATRNAWVEKAALGLVLGLLVTDALGSRGNFVALLAAAAGVAHAWRWALWRPWKTRGAALVWVLHLAYLWIPVHLALRALAELGVVAQSSSTHALSVGAAGGLIIGMMIRTTRGHTGRPLLADRFDTACFVLVLLAAAVRVGVPLLSPADIVPAVLGSAVLWSAGFGLYAVHYWRALCLSRLDGRPG